MITASTKNEYFFDILIPREFQKEVKEQFKSDINLECFSKKKNNGNCEFNFQLEFEKLCKKSKCEEFPDRGLAYIRNHTMLLEGRNFDWKMFAECPDEYLRNSFFLSQYQTITSRSSEPEAKRVPVVLKWSELTQPSWPSSLLLISRREARCREPMRLWRKRER